MEDVIISVDNVTKAFRGGVRALDGLSLSVARGTVHGLLGPNGAGKTTLIRILTTLLKPDSGSARIAGVDVISEPAAVRASIGLAGQYAAVDEFLTGRENVEMIGRLYGLPTAASHRRATDMLERMGLAAAADRQVKTYSGGMRRRLDLAASLVGRPVVLLLDEPTTGLDPASRRDLWGLIQLLVQEGTTILLTTQYLEEADRLADHITVIGEGRVISTGTPEELKATVGGATVEVTVEYGYYGRTLDALRDLGAQPSSSLHETILLPAADGTNTLRQVLHRLDTTDVDVVDISLRRPTLDDVFLSLTGHSSISHAPTDGRAA